MSKKKKIYQAPKGTRDILPDEQIFWQKIYQVAKNLSDAYGFLRLDPPVFEETELFIKSTGLTTDIVEKEMYSFKTKGGDNITLRPEFTPGLVRAYLENGLSGLPHPVKLYSLGPVFRYERAQSGRWRQFHQLNFEAFGSKDPVIDAQVIFLIFNFLKELGLRGFNIQINSLGCSQCRAGFRKAVVNYYQSRLKGVCANCKKRFKSNPLRLLDCKEKECQEIAETAPQMIDYLCQDCHDHFKAVLEFLDELELPYFLNGHLVRGLDYYTRTVFEIWPEEYKEKAQATLAGGGRYDSLIQSLGGPETPAVGGGLGIERIIYLMKSQGVKISNRYQPKIFMVQLGDLSKKKSLRLFEELRKSGFKVAETMTKDSIKVQLKIADKLGVKYALILGQKEALDNTVIVRDMESGVQENIPLSRIIKEMKKRLSSN